ncbi:hypothetical protein Tco_1468232 [Tanacetum coccineum]
MICGSLYHWYPTLEVVKLSLSITSSTTTSRILVVVSQVEMKYRLAMINMLSRESHTRDENENNSMDMRLIGNLQKMSIQDEESLRSQNFRLSNGMATSIWIRSLPRGFIYQNKDKKNRLMRLEELHKFSDGTLDDFRTALDDRLKGIRMEYLPKTIWRQSDRECATALI